MAFKKATVNASDVAATLSNYPSYVDLSRLGITTLAEAQSVRVYADEAKTTEWAREIVSATEMHVKIPSLTSTTDIYVDYDGIRADYAVTATYGRNAVWTTYGGAFHLNESSGNATDSTAGLTFTNNNTVGYASGKIGNSADFGASNTNKNFTTTSHFGLAAGAARSISCWVNVTTAPASGAVYDIFGMSDEPEDVAYLFEYGNFSGTRRLRIGRARYYVDDPTLLYRLDMGTGTWYHIAYTIDASRNQTLYVNGASVATNTAVAGNGSGPVFDGSYLSRAGFAVTRVYSGKLDEVKVAPGVLTANWITTEYNNQNDEATFWGTWTDAGGGGPTANNSARRQHLMMM